MHYFCFAQTNSMAIWLFPIISKNSKPQSCDVLDCQSPVTNRARRAPPLGHLDVGRCMRLYCPLRPPRTRGFDRRGQIASLGRRGGFRVGRCRRCTARGTPARELLPDATNTSLCECASLLPCVPRGKHWLATLRGTAAFTLSSAIDAPRRGDSSALAIKLWRAVLSRSTAVRCHNKPVLAGGVQIHAWGFSDPRKTRLPMPVLDLPPLAASKPH